MMFPSVSTRVARRWAHPSGGPIRPSPVRADERLEQAFMRRSTLEAHPLPVDAMCEENGTACK